MKILKHFSPATSAVRIGCFFLILSVGFSAVDTAYNSKCKYCHGPDGKGDPIIARSLNVQLRPLSQSTTEEVRTVIEKGRGKMQALRLTPQQVDSIVAFVNSLKEKAR